MKLRTLPWIAFCIGVPVLIAGLLAAMLADETCDTTVIGEWPSPSGRLRAVLLSRDCGATTGFNRHVQILRNGEPLHDSSPFVMDADHGKATLDVQLRWSGDDRLTIGHDPQARVFRAETQAGGVAITYASPLN